MILCKHYNDQLATHPNAALEKLKNFIIYGGVLLCAFGLERCSQSHLFSIVEAVLLDRKWSCFLVILPSVAVTKKGLLMKGMGMGNVAQISIGNKRIPL